MATNAQWTVIFEDKLIIKHIIHKLDYKKNKIIIQTLKKKDNIQGYIKTIVKDHNKITSGRKNFEKHHRRILETLKLVKKYFNLKN